MPQQKRGQAAEEKIQERTGKTLHLILIFWVTSRIDEFNSMSCGEFLRVVWFIFSVPVSMVVMIQWEVCKCVVPKKTITIKYTSLIY